MELSGTCNGRLASHCERSDIPEWGRGPSNDTVAPPGLEVRMHDGDGFSDREIARLEVMRRIDPRCRDLQYDVALFLSLKAREVSPERVSLVPKIRLKVESG